MPLKQTICVKQHQTVCEDGGDLELNTTDHQSFLLKKQDLADL